MRTKTSPTSSGVISMSTASTSILGMYTSDTWMSSNLMADLMSSLSLFSRTPSSSISSIMTSSSSSVRVASSSPFDIAAVIFPKNQEMGLKMTSRTRMMPQILRHTFSGLRLAIDLGMISPNIRTRTVMTTVEATAPVSAPRRMAKNRVAMEVPAMLTRLFPIRTVVRSLS